MQPRHKRQPGGFTLLELMLVMIIVLTAVAIAAPQLQGWAHGSKLRNSADEFLKLARYARSQSVADATIYRIQFESAAGKYQVKKKSVAQASADLTYTDVKGSIGDVCKVPDGGQLQLTVESDARLKVEGDVKECIDFYPSGRTQTSTIRMTDGKGNEIEIVCESPAEDFYVKYEGKTQSK